MTEEEYLASQHTRLAKLIRKRTGEKHTKILNVVKTFDIRETLSQVSIELELRDRQEMEEERALDR